MRESRFIAQNKEKWSEAETLLQSSTKDPEKLSSLFIQVVDDLSYSRTYYPNRSVRVYLNKIARQYFSIIASHKKEKHNRFTMFWLDELPQIILFCRRPMLISLAVFLVALVVGVFSSYNDPQFVNTILGSDYVSMTDENILKNDPMAVYKKSHEVDMFFGITFNNLMVAFRTYVLGIFLGIGTLGSLIQNGIMVGCFQYYFVARDLFLESALTIWLHGTLEISAIILAGGAGLTLGSGLVFPGTYSRMQALQLAGIRSLKLMLGITPVFVLAAVIESFLTRYTEAPMLLKLLLILLSAAFIIGYFVVYPWLKSKKGFLVPLREVRLPPSTEEATDFTRIKNNADLLKDTFQFYSRASKTILSWGALVALGVSIGTFFFEEEVFLVMEQQWWYTLSSDMLFALGTPTPVFIAINALGTTFMLYRVMMLVDGEFKKTAFTWHIQSFLQILLITAVLYTAIYLGAWGMFLLVLGIGYLLFVAFTQLTEQSSLMYGLAHGWYLFWKNANQGMYLNFILLLLSASFLLVLAAPVYYIHLSVLKWNFVETDPWSKNIIHFIEIYIKTYSFYIVFPIVAAGFSYLYFSQEEATTARNLLASIKKLGVNPSKTSRG